MPYINIQNFLSDEKPEIYNFEFEFDVTNYDKNMRTFDRYFVYQAWRREDLEEKILDSNQINKNEYKCQKDPDGSSGKCELTLDIYNKLWNWEKGDNPRYGTIKDFNHASFGGDTMNSVQTTMGYCLKEIRKESKQRLDYEQEIGDDYSIRACLQLYCKFHDRFIFDLESYFKGLSKYIDAYHTIGNFILVPQYFNPYRNSKEKDYWDRSLWLLKKRKNCIEEPWIYKNGKVEENIKWNKEDYKKYINTFFLWDYVNSEGNPRPISPCNNSLENFLEITTKLIRRRGCFMVAMLQVYQKLGEERYAKLRDRVFAKSDAIYESYKTVFNKIREVLCESEIAEVGNILICAENQIFQCIQ